MKNKIHPEYNDILIIMTDGSTYKTKSTVKRKKSLWRLDMDTKSNSYWNGLSSVDIIDVGSQRAKFEKRFSLGN